MQSSKLKMRERTIFNLALTLESPNASSRLEFKRRKDVDLMADAASLSLSLSFSQGKGERKRREKGCEFLHGGKGRILEAYEERPNPRLFPLNDSRKIFNASRRPVFS